MANRNYDIVIVGGGMVGTALACAVARSGFRIAVIDSVEPPPFENSEYDLRVSSLTLGSKAIFETVGAWQDMTQQRVSCVDAMEIWDEGGSGSIRFDSAEIAQPCLAYIIENRVILRALLNCMTAIHNIEYISPVQIETIETDDQQALVRLETGESLQTRLIVGADGANSLVRKLSGIETDGWNFEQKAIVATVISELGHQRIARQRFLATGPLAFLPLDDAHHCSIVWSADNDRADTLIALEDAEFNCELQRAFGDRLGEVKLASLRAMFPLITAHAKQYLAERIVLVGDAAHRIHPLAGQGLNLGLGDIAALAEVLVEAGREKHDIGAHRILRRYERWRKGGNALMLGAMDGFKQLFGSKNDVVRGLRNVGLELTDDLPPIKQRIMLYAAGQSGDLPKLMRGINL
ncbi:MAG: UbiH/UbiF/VisC/COQ6 family ubiquinone biosynthesis hydroxylase [Acidiferrobacterales bacterium]